MFTGEEKDTKLFEKITMPEEKSGLLNLVLPALNQLIEDNEFIGSDDIDTVQEDYILNSNTVASFVQERCEVSESEEDYTICRDLYYAYVDHCTKAGRPKKNDNIFGSELALLHIEKDRVRVNGM